MRVNLNIVATLLVFSAILSSSSVSANDFDYKCQKLSDDLTYILHRLDDKFKTALIDFHNTRRATRRTKNPISTSPPTQAEVKSWINAWKKNRAISPHQDETTIEWILEELSEYMGSTDNSVRHQAERLYQRVSDFRSKGIFRNKNLTYGDSLPIHDALQFFTQQNSILEMSYASEWPFRQKIVERKFYPSKSSPQGLKETQKNGHFDTHRSLTFQNLNDLSPYPIYPIEIRSRPKKADNIWYDAEGYAGHDASHASGKANKVDRNIWAAIELKDWKTVDQIIEEREKIYSKFRDVVDHSRNPKVREILELIWFDYFHEINRSKIEMTRDYIRKIDLGTSDERYLDHIRSGVYGSSKLLKSCTKEDFHEAFRLFKKFQEQLNQ